jgi:hypothetical protein
MLGRRTADVVSPGPDYRAVVFLVFDESKRCANHITDVIRRQRISLRVHEAIQYDHGRALGLAGIDRLDESTESAIDVLGPERRRLNPE